MKNNFFASKKPKTGFIALLLLFFGLFANVAVAQDTFVWDGSTDNNWATGDNWTITRGGTPGTDAYPGETRLIDLVEIKNGGTPAIASSGSYTIRKLTITNAVGFESGSTLTIDNGATLNVINSVNQLVLLNGGNILNNGILNLDNSTYNAATSQPVVLGTPTALPASPTVYGYSGSGTLSINLSGATVINSAAFTSTSANANTTYKLEFTAAKTTFSLGNNTAACYAIRAAATAGTTTSPVIIGGTGFTLGTVISPVNGGLLQIGATNNITINSGTTLTMNSANTNVALGIAAASGSTLAPTVLTNKGTINILGFSTRNGINFSTTSPTAALINFLNEGTTKVDLNISVAGTAPLATTNGGGTGTAAGLITITNTGTMTLKNTATIVGGGAPIFAVVAGQVTPIQINNEATGTLNLEGSSYSYGSKVSITNNGIINSNSEFRSFTNITNNASAAINFVRTAATATTRQVVFNGLTFASAAAIGTTYTDAALNTYAVVSQKFTSTTTGTTLITNVLSGAVTTPSGNLTKTGSGAGDATIAYTGFSAPAINGALTTTTTNSGTINTDTASNLNIISGVTTSSTSIIAPGGASGKGIVDFAKATAALTGKVILQISGDAIAGVDYDQITNSAVGGSLSVGGTLDVTGIYTPAGPVTIDIVTTEATGSLTGAFNSNVIGITTGWSVVTTTGTAGKVQLVYSATAATATTWTGGTSIGWIDATNWSNGVPDQNSDVTIGNGTFQPSPFVNVSIKSLTIDTGSTLQLNPTYNFTVKETITNNGSITVLNNANLIQVDNVANTGTGTTTVKRNSNALSRLDYTLWSSPVTGSQTLAGFSPETDITRFYNYNETTNQYNAIADPSAVSFAAAAGYLIRMPNTAVTFPATETFAGTFTGVPNNGDITKAMTYNGASFGYNAIGNPYPSTIDAQAFIAANTANIESSLYFWRKINAAAGSAYAVYTPLGSTTATPSSALSNGTIQVGQGFFVKAKSASNVTFTNAMRVANNQNQFFKTKQVAQKDRVWLNLTNTSGVFSQALVGYTADATSGVDMYDAKYINDSKIALTSNINDEEYTIQGRPTFDPADVVSLNFKTDAAGDYTIALDHFDGVFAAGQDVYLVDIKTGTETNLKSGSYTFNAVAGVDNTRFNLKYQTSLKVDAKAFNENNVAIYKNNGTLYVNSGAVAISNIKVFDIQGRLIAEQKNVKATTAAIKNLKATQQVLVVKITGEDNNVVTKKVVN